MQHRFIHHARRSARAIPFRWLTLACFFAFLLAYQPATASAQSLVQQFTVHDPTSTATVDHGALGQFLSRYLTTHEDGVTRVAYGRVTADDRARLNTYIETLEQTQVTALNRDEQFAFWANLYNAVTVRLIVERYPVDSIRDIKNGLFSIGPWGIKLVTVEGRALTLDNVEHDILRKIWKDPRVHYAVNCASIGCPNLYAQPFTGAGLDAQLTANARAYVNNPRGARFDERGRLYVSRIYRWFREDFGGNTDGVLKHLRLYADTDLAARLAQTNSIAGYRYDWALNDSTNLQDAR